MSITRSSVAADAFILFLSTLSHTNSSHANPLKLTTSPLIICPSLIVIVHAHARGRNYKHRL